MMLRPIHAPNPDVLSIPTAALSLLDPAADRQAAALLLYGIEQGWISEDAASKALAEAEARDAAYRQIGEGLSHATEQAALAVAEGIVPEGQGFTLLEIGLPDDERFYTPPDAPALRVELRILYHEPIPLASLPHSLGVAVCVALQLLQAFFPLLIAEDMLQFVWFEQELADEARLLAQKVDLDTLTGEELDAFVDADPNRFCAISEQLHLGNEVEWLLGRLRELSAPPPAAKIAADCYQPVSTDTKAALLLQWLDAWREQGPSLADHPLARWVERVARVVSRQIAEGRSEGTGLLQPDDGEFIPPDAGFVVTFCEEWEDQSLEYLFERLNQGAEAPLSLIPLDPLALSKTHATLMALAEGTALLECLTVFNA